MERPRYRRVSGCLWLFFCPCDAAVVVLLLSPPSLFVTPPRPSLFCCCIRSVVSTGWEADQTASGETYYVNHATRSTTWQRPAALGGGAPRSAGVSSGAGNAGGGEAPLPPGACIRLVPLLLRAFVGGVFPASLSCIAGVVADHLLSC